MGELVAVTERGLWCEAGGFFIDPLRPTAGDRAIITHAHSDHARVGADQYLCASSGLGVLRHRLGVSARIEGIAFGERRCIGACEVSLHPAGHVLGSAMVRVEHRGEVWVVSGDYKTQRDCSGEEIEPVACDVFITESTFALPIYRWEARERVLGRINAWWAGNASAGVTSIVYAYSLGKAQSVLAGLDASIGPIYVHGAVDGILPMYREAGVALPACERADKANVREARGRAIVVAPPSADNSTWARRFGERREAMASGWMRVRGPRRRAGLDAGFELSDHADWDGLLRVIDATGASRVGVTHGSSGVLARYLRERGIDAWSLDVRRDGGEEA